jgi:hypothetical protein
MSVEDCGKKETPTDFAEINSYNQARCQYHLYDSSNEHPESHHPRLEPEPDGRGYVR